jgi:4-coumarate--CoA ligase
MPPTTLCEISSDAYLDAFMLDNEDKNGDIPWFIDSTSCATWTKAQVRHRVALLALALQAKYSLGLSYSPSKIARGYLGEVVAFISPNDIDYAVCVWALHRLGCAVACCNAAGTESELAHQFRLSSPSLIIVHPSALNRVLAAMAACSISPDCVVVLSRTVHASASITSESLINQGETLEAHGKLVQRTLSPGQEPVAFLCFSSGTTGQFSFPVEGSRI